MPYNNSKGPKMESAKQERKDLLRDNPVVRDMDSRGSDHAGLG